MFVHEAIDLNCDLGEGCPNDAELMRLVSSANIACGYHAGDSDTMRRTIDLARDNGVAIGAHPGYKDKKNFGRTAMTLSRQQIIDLVSEQISALKTICDDVGAMIRHVKLHGALYNQAAKDREIAAAIARAVRDLDDGLIFYGLSGSVMIQEAEHLGLQTASEVFADRTYQNDGTLTPRTLDNALITDQTTAITQVMDMVKYGRVRSVDAVMVAIKAETVCIHGDGRHAVEFAEVVRERLTAHGIEIRSPLKS